MYFKKMVILLDIEYLNQERQYLYINIDSDINGCRL